ncbi:putative ribonuclease H-like domain-containing protein [Tanacetum coccineum]
MLLYQRIIKVRTFCINAVPKRSMPIFIIKMIPGILDAVKARFGGNEESKKMRKTMLKQQFIQFSGQKKKMATKEVMTVSKSTSSSIGHSYGVKAASYFPHHSAFSLEAASSGSKLTYSDQQETKDELQHKQLPDLTKGMIDATNVSIGTLARECNVKQLMIRLRLHADNGGARLGRCMQFPPPSITGTYMPSQTSDDNRGNIRQDMDSVPCKSKAASILAGIRNSQHLLTLRVGTGSNLAAAQSNPAGWSKIPSTCDPSTDKDIGIVDSGCSKVMTGNKENLIDFELVKGGIGQIWRRRCISELQPEQNVTCLVAKASLDESTRWHRRMAHVNFKTINKLAKEGLVDGLPLKVFTNEHNCVACNKGKQHKASYKHISAVRLITETLQLLHMDLFGPTNIRSIDQKYYSLVVTDDFSRFTWTFFLGTKDETFYVLKEFIALIENQLNKKVKGIRCDNGTEFKNAKLIELCGEKGIKRDYSNPRTPQQNGVAERKNRTLIEAARTMLADSKLPTMFWTEAVSMACYVLNRVSITNPHNKTPYELISGKVPQIGHLKPFGCQVTILNTSDHLGKFEGKADEGYLVGYASNSKAYRVYNLTHKRVEETLNLRFLEDKPNVQGIGHEWYFDLDYLTDSLGYTRFKSDKPAGTQETNIDAGTHAHDSDSEVDEQVIVVPSFPSTSFAGPSSRNGSSVMERNADFAEELAKLQRQEHEAKDAAARYGYLFSQTTADILSQAEAEIRNKGVSADRDPAGSVSAGSTSASSDPAGGHPAGPFQPAGSYDPAAMGDPAALGDPAAQGDPAASTSVSADFIPVHADESTLPPGQVLGSSENTTRFPVPSDVCKDQLSSGIFTSSSYDNDFRATLTNLCL